MPDVPAVDANALKAALLQRGMLAERGRYTPFASVDAGNTPASVLSGVVASNNAGTAAPGVTVVAAPGAASTNDPNAAGSTALPIGDDTLDKMGEGDATKLLVGLGIGTAALTAYLLRRRTRLNQPTDDIPLVDADEVIHPKPTATGTKVQDGEVVETKVPITNTKRITGGVDEPNNEGMKALGAPKEVAIPAPTGPKKRSAAQSIAERAARGQPNDTGTIPMRDQMSDLTYDEKMQANYLTEQLIANRKAGNSIQQRRMTGARNLGTNLPSGSIDRPRILNEVIRLIRSGKIKPATVARVVP